MIYSNILSNETVSFILGLPEVQDAKTKVEVLEKGHIYFEIQMTEDILSALQQHFNLDLTGIQKIPMRWVKGDTLPHVDSSRDNRSFDNTYLIYLTDSQGELVIDNSRYPIQKNTGYIFSEGLYHETVDTGSTPRLLLGPMNEFSQPVGIFGIDVAGGTAIYLRQGSPIEWSSDQVTWNPIYFPCYINNTNTSLGVVKVILTTNITINSVWEFFYIFSSYIQFGSETLNNDGSRPTITINADNYDGLIQNGDGFTNGNGNVSIYNLYLDGGSNQTQVNGSWLCKIHYGYNATNNYIVNCASSGIINGGGLVGAYGGSGGILILRGCSSSGIIGDNAGGIAGQYAGYGSGSLVCESCWSTGLIQGDGAGGIVGSNNNNVTISNCYSQGSITGNNAGGIIGSNSGIDSATVSNSYSNGNIIGSNAGGICGSIGAITSTHTVSILNCYSTGNLSNSISSTNGGICGALIQSSPGQISLTLSNCYTTGTVTYSSGYIIGNNATVNGVQLSQPVYTLTNNYSEAGSGGTPGTWNDANANTALTTGWVSTVTGQPYELLNMGYSPYSLTNISGSNLVRTASSSINAGLSTTAGTTSTYSILQKSGGSPSSYGTITINGTTGVISTTSGTVPGVYTLLVRNTGSYDFTTFTLTVTAAICFLKGTTLLCADGKYRKIEELKKGDMVKTYLHGDVAIDIICHTDIHHSREKDKKEQLFVYKKQNLPFLTEDLVLTGGHSVLVDHLTETQEQSTIEMIKRICVTDNKYRLLSCIDERTVPYEKEESDETIYHICLHHPNPNMNYGIWANGMLSETCQKSVINRYIH